MMEVFDSQPGPGSWGWEMMKERLCEIELKRKAQLDVSELLFLLESTGNGR